MTSPSSDSQNVGRVRARLLRHTFYEGRVPPDPLDLAARIRPIDQEHVEVLKDWLEANPGRDLDPIDVCVDNQWQEEHRALSVGPYHLLHGQHRLEAYLSAGREFIPANIHQGVDMARDAVIAARGNRTTRPEKPLGAGAMRNALLLLFESHPGWVEAPGPTLADLVGCTAQYANRIRTIFLDEKDPGVAEAVEEAARLGSVPTETGSDSDGDEKGGFTELGMGEVGEWLEAHLVHLKALRNEWIGVCAPVLDEGVRSALEDALEAVDAAFGVLLQRARGGRDTKNKEKKR